MMNTEAIYSQFKESIKSAVHTTKITSIAKTGRFNSLTLNIVECWINSPTVTRE